MTHFFKYMSRDAALATLQNGTLRWSTPPTLNDPFDMQFAFQLRIDKEVARPVRWTLVTGETVGSEHSLVVISGDRV